MVSIVALGEVSPDNPHFLLHPACSGLIYSGVPSALPANVSALPLADEGISVRSPAPYPGSTFPGGFQTPIDHQCLAVLADDDVSRLNVAMEDAARAWSDRTPTSGAARQALSLELSHVRLPASGGSSPVTPVAGVPGTHPAGVRAFRRGTA